MGACARCNEKQNKLATYSYTPTPMHACSYLLTDLSLSVLKTKHKSTMHAWAYMAPTIYAYAYLPTTQRMQAKLSAKPAGDG